MIVAHTPSGMHKRGASEQFWKRPVLGVGCIECSILAASTEAARSNAHA